MVGFSGLLFGGCLSCQHGHNNNKCSSWDGAVPRACSLTARSFPFLPLAHQIKFRPTQGQFMYKSWHHGTVLPRNKRCNKCASLHVSHGKIQGREILKRPLAALYFTRSDIVHGTTLPIRLVPCYLVRISGPAEPGVNGTLNFWYLGILHIWIYLIWCSKYTYRV